MSERFEFDVVQFEDGCGWVYIKGHGVFTPAMIDQAADELGRDDKRIMVTETYLAKLQTAESRSSGWASEIRDYHEPGRGRFKSTVFSFEDQFDKPTGVRCGSFMPAPFPKFEKVKPC